MAGIAFELKKILKENKLTSLLFAFTYSTSLSAGPWIISIISIIIAGIVAEKTTASHETVRQYQIVITYITAFSLILSGAFQLLFTRYVADRLFEKEDGRILPNFMGVLLLNMLIGFTFAILFSLFTSLKEIYQQMPWFVILFILSLTLMTGFWIINTLLTSFKSYKYILLSFTLGFGLMIISSPYLGKFGLSGLMLSYFCGTSVIFLMLMGYIFKHYSSEKLIEFDFLKRHRIHISLAFIGLFYNIAIWADKFVFWFSNTTGESVIGPFKASIVYDVPIFLAYLAIAPGMGIFFLKLESEFAEHYNRYYAAVREGETLDRIYELGHELILAVRTLIQEVLRIQAIAVILIFLMEITIFRFFHLSLLYLPLFNVLLLGTYLQLVIMAILSVLFYFDLRMYALYTTFTFAVLNFLLSKISIIAGPFFYGYGFFLSLIMSFLVGIFLLRRFLNEIHYRTFMLI
ncbi:exopolysaccharide Pel transporter PelG [Desulfurobacterium sp.]